jgi:DNA polymerase type B, organellar and viral
MMPERIAQIARPSWHCGVKPNHQGFADGGYLSLGFDTETTHGIPYTLQCAGPDGDFIWYMKPERFLPRLLRWLEPYVRAQRAANTVLWGHVLSFDLVALLYPYRRRFAEEGGTFEVSHHGVGIQVYYGRNPFAKIRFPHGRTVWVLDTFAFLQTSLRRAAEIFDLPFDKLPKPRGLGRRVLRGAAFRAYALRDAVVARALGERLVVLHEEFDLGLTVSIAHFAGRCFAHNYLTTPWAGLPAEVEEAALLSYHGGKNGFYTRPGWVRDCREYDISSAYPAAMTRGVPSLAAGDWYEVDRFEGDYEGFYRVSGDVPQNEPYPCLFSHEFQPLRGRFSDTWVTSHELREALRSREVQMSDIRGYVWVPRRPYDYPLKRYVSDFYRLKEHAADPAMRRVYKLALNALYGKFIQLTPSPDGLKPGAYFRPDVASWVTGWTRALIHRLEHRARALHTATDAIHTRLRLPERKGLGGLECSMDGPALLVRNKVYFHFSRDGTEMKCALHGIHAGPRHVWNLLRAGKRSYRHTRLVRPREAVRLKLRPLDAHTRWYTIGVGDLRFHPIPRAARTFWTRQRGKAR